MSKVEKLYTSIKRNPKDRTFRELVSLLEKFGFCVVKKAGRGSHCAVYHPNYSDLRWTLSERKPMKAYHAKQAIHLVEEVMDREQK